MTLLQTAIALDLTLAGSNPSTTSIYQFLQLTASSQQTFSWSGSHFWHKFLALPNSKPGLRWIALFQITETMKNISWKRPLEVIWPNTLLKLGLPQLYDQQKKILIGLQKAFFLSQCSKSAFQTCNLRKKILGGNSKRSLWMSDIFSGKF